MQDFFFQKINQNKCVELDERVTVENKPEKQAQRVTKKFENWVRFTGQKGFPED